MSCEIEYRGYTIKRDEYQIAGKWRAYPADYDGENLLFGDTVDDLIVEIDGELYE